MMFNIVYEPRVEDPVIVAQFDTLAEAELYIKEVQIKRPQTYKYTSIVVEE